MENNHLTIIKRFTNWAELKLKIQLYKDARLVYFKERQIWWASVGQNIGTEQNGKHKNFERPVLVLKKFNADMFLSVPLSGQYKPGSYRFIFKREGVWFTANLSQIKVISSKRLLRQVGKMGRMDFEKLKQMFRKLT